MSNEFQIRETDHAVLTCIRQGFNTTFDVKQETTLKNSAVRYSFEKLENQGLIKIEDQDGYIERVVDGQKRTFKAPKKARITDKAGQYFQQTQRETELDKYRDLSREELVEKVAALENRVEKLENGFTAFKRQIKKQLQE